MTRPADRGEPTSSLVAPVVALVVSLSAIVLGCAYALARWTTPSTCGWVAPRSEHFQGDAVVATGHDGCAIAGIPLVGADATTTAVTFRTATGTLTAPLVDSPELVGHLLRDGISTVLYVVSLATLGFVYFIRRPTDPIAQAATLSGSTVLGAGLAWSLGLPPEQVFDGWLRWLYLACVQLCFLATWGPTLGWVVLVSRAQLHKPPTHRWWWLVPAPIALWALVAIPAAFVSPTFPAWLRVASLAEALVAVVFLAIILVLVGLQLLRIRRGDPIVAQQVKWAGGSAAAALLLMSAFWFVPLAATGSTLLPHELIGVPGLLLVAGVGVSVFKHRRFEVDFVVARTIVFSALSLVTVVLYLVITGVLAAVFTSVAPSSMTAATAILLAVSIHPVRLWLQRGVNHLFYGERDNPYRTLSRVARQVRSQRLPDVLSEIARGLRAPYAAITADGATVAAWGAAPPSVDDLVTVPLEHSGTRLGDLVLGRRARGETYSRVESTLLADLSGPLALLLHEQQQAARLRESREQIVVAREEERRRLRRTLHDEVAPTVAGLGLKVQTVRAMVGREQPDFGAVDDLLDQMVGDAASAAGSLRALSYDLRPPALDDRGLLEALKDRAQDLRPIASTFTADGDWSQPLPAAVEVAVYRIVTSALANVAQHAGASSVGIELVRRPEEVRLRVTDDGRGLGRVPRSGVGLTAMRERAAELGGSFAARSRQGDRGTVVEAALPLEVAP